MIERRFVALYVVKPGTNTACEQCGEPVVAVRRFEEPEWTTRPCGLVVPLPGRVRQIAVNDPCEHEARLLVWDDRVYDHVTERIAELRAWYRENGFSE